jgi:class 3 adenylate cyclase
MTVDLFEFGVRSDRTRELMSRQYPFPMLELPAELARQNGWTEEVYRDLLALRAGQMGRDEFDARYLRRRAIVVLDLAGYTASCLQGRQAEGLLRILDTQRICVPVLREHEAVLVRAFADDLVALFHAAGPALAAAFEIQRRLRLFNEERALGDDDLLCGIGIGYGEVYAIGPNLAMGDEVNRAAWLGEDTACGAETLVTENVYASLCDRTDVNFAAVSGEGALFPYFRALPSGEP